MKQHRNPLRLIGREAFRTVTRTPKKVFAKLAGQPWPPVSEVTLDAIIAPEVRGTPLFARIQEIVSSDTGIHNILEIGASSGDGSTEAFVAGVGQRPAAIYTFEISRTRFARLQERYRHVPQLRPLNESSVAIADFPSPEELKDFHRYTKTNLSRTRLAEVLRWRALDIDYIHRHQIPQDGIARLKATAGIDTFDCVLIDGSEFTGRKEFELVYGSKYVILDDINAFKNYANHQRLLDDSSYELIESDFECRNGYSIFKRAANVFAKSMSKPAAATRRKAA
ncbi:MAG TPA: hypothetical protein VHY91_24425 [Pirellulales bacterium]|jgi:hypothetical protein|nr:hypothetical protein [Pirellulales bacterium]